MLSVSSWMATRRGSLHNSSETRKIPPILLMWNRNAKNAKARETHKYEQSKKRCIHNSPPNNAIQGKKNAKKQKAAPIQPLVTLSQQRNQREPKKQTNILAEIGVHPQTNIPSSSSSSSTPSTTPKSNSIQSSQPTTGSSLTASAQFQIIARSEKKNPTPDSHPKNVLPHSQKCSQVFFQSRGNTPCPAPHISFGPIRSHQAKTFPPTRTDRGSGSELPGLIPRPGPLNPGGVLVQVLLIPTLG